MPQSQDIRETLGLLIHHSTDPLVFWIVCAIVVVILLKYHQVFEASVFALAMILTTGVTTLLKILFAIERPTDALVTLTTYSFPSGHASASAALAITLAWILFREHYSLRRRIVFVCGLFVIALLISWSRVAIGVHTLFDISIGILVGLSIPAGVIYLCTRIKDHRQSNRL